MRDRAALRMQNQNPADDGAFHVQFKSVLTLSLLLISAILQPAMADEKAAKKAEQKADEKVAKKAETKADPQIGQSFEVPYILTQTNHFVVRALINGKGPFHLVVDTGAPGLFLATEAAKKAGVTSHKEKFFSNLEELRLEGGPTLKNLNIRVEDPFQLVGMNSLGLPGVKLDGLMGFSVLARYRITLDPTHKRMFWTRLDFNPKETIDDIPVARKEDVPLELQAMNMLGPAMKVAAMFIGKQPETKRLPQGFAGFEMQSTAQEKKLIVKKVLSESPAEKAGLMPGDAITMIDDKSVKTLDELARAIEKKSAGVKIKIQVDRKETAKTIEFELSEGF